MGLATARAHLTGYAAPLNVMISVTNRCPARCGYCDIPNRKQREMNTNEITRLFDELKSLGTQRVALWGGEPLIRDDIGYLIDYAKRKCDFFVSLDTNGYLVPQKMAELKNLDVLVISFDGPPEVHDRNREPGSFAKVMEAFKAACPVMRVFTITVLTRENIGHIDFILDAARRNGFYATFQLLHHTEELASKNELSMIPDEDEYKKTIEHIIRRKREGAPIVSSIPYLKYILDWQNYRESRSSERRGLKCWAGTLYCNVDTDGTVYPCSGLVGKVPARNFMTSGFKDAFALARNFDCRSCVASCYTEYNLMHSFNLEVISNWLKYTAAKSRNQRQALRTS